MNKFLDFFKRHPLTRNICLVILASLVLVFIIYLCLLAYTGHGDTRVVPDAIGLKVETAARLFDAKDLNYEVVDSVFSNAVPKGTIVEQDPASGSVVKEGRKVYLTINATQDQKIVIPEVLDISVRQATTILTASGLVVEKVTYKPSEYKDLVLGVYFRGNQVNPGDEVLVGTPLELYVGSGEAKIEADSIMSVEENGTETLEEEILF
ncbi:MAG: PASTA domain-containing protein [Paludibacteraceae bacterium]|nr:PASTA domain-containing protein [Paludibacteraceae bacterium]